MKIIDVRTPLEFAEDHICRMRLDAPVLSNEGGRILSLAPRTEQISPFEGTQIGAQQSSRATSRAAWKRLRRPAAQLAAADLLLAQQQTLGLRITTLFNIISWAGAPAR